MERGQRIAFEMVLKAWFVSLVCLLNNNSFIRIDFEIFELALALQGPKPESEHPISSLYLGGGGLDIEVSLPNYSKFCENSESVQFLKLRSTQKRMEWFF